MKRKELIKYLTEAGCVLHREGAKHSVFSNPTKARIATVPRHREIDDELAKKIFRQLAISPPKR